MEKYFKLKSNEEIVMADNKYLIKKILIILMSVIMIFGLTGCGSKDKMDGEIKIGKESNIDITDKAFSLKIKEDTLTNSGAVIILENNSNNTISFGEEFWLEIEQNGKWYALETINDYVVNVPLYHIEPNDSKEMSFGWGHAFGKLPKGKYRITKRITLEFENDKKEDTHITCEFNVD